jgi:hypothetical protein
MQAVGVFILSLATSTTFFEVVSEYAQLITTLTDQEGIHIAAYIPISFISIAVLVTCLYSFGIWRSLNGHFSNLDRYQEALLLSVAICWSLLTIYHRLYDAIVLFYVYVLLVRVAKQPQTWGMPEQATRSIWLILAPTTGILCLPGAVIAPFVSSDMLEVFLNTINVLSTFTVIVYSVLLFVILRRYSENVTNEQGAAYSHSG